MNASRIVGRADALYFAVAITVTIIELAVIATTPTLGALALEYSLIAQLTLSVLVEFGAAYILVRQLGVVRATHAGFTIKALSCCLFFSGVAVASHSFLTGWVLILASFVLDAIGTGLLKAAFRPAYCALHSASTGKSADYVNSLRAFGLIRLGLPCALLFLVGVAHFYLEGLRLISLMFLVVMGCRCIQIVLSRSDLGEVPSSLTNNFEALQHGSASQSIAFKKAPALWAYYIAGTVLESVLLMYGIGLIYKYRSISFFPDAVSWMGASAISLWIYLVSYAGAGSVVTYWAFLKNNNYFLSVCMCLVAVIVYLLLKNPGGLGYLVGLFGFCLSASVSAILLIRHASTQLLTLFTEQDCARIFIWAELAANAVLIIIVIAATVLLGPESIIRIFGIVLALSTAVVIMLRVMNARNRPD